MPEPDFRLPPLIRVAIIEDQDELRQGLAYLIDATEGFRCRQHFASMEDALQEIAEPLEIALVDIGLPGMSGIDGVKKTPPARLIESLREAMQGGAPMSPEIARRVIE